MDLKKKVLSVLESGYEKEQAFVKSLSDEEGYAAGKADEWSAKEDLAHMAVWKQRRARNLMARLHGQPQVDFGDYQKLNEQDFEVNKALAWSDVMMSVEQGHGLLVDCVEAMQAEDLLAVEEGRGPLWQGIVGSGYTHPVMHLTDYLFRHGKPAEAHKIWEEAVARLAELDDSNDWQGACRYNLACSYARSGQTDRAVEALRQALALNPGLTDWSKQDGDLDSLRERADYKAIYAG